METENTTPKKKRKRLTKAEYKTLQENGHADLLPKEVLPMERPKVAPNAAQLRKMDALKNHWLAFKFAVIFRAWKLITGEQVHQPAKGLIDVNGRPKNGLSPQEFILKHLGLEMPLQERKHKLAYSVIAEMYEITPPPARPEGNLWETLVPQGDTLIEKWCGIQDPFLKMPFHDALKTARMELRWTQGNLADEVKYQSLAVSRWERGEYEPSPQAVYEIARVMPRMKLWFRNSPDWLKAHGVPGI